MEVHPWNIIFIDCRAFRGPCQQCSETIGEHPTTLGIITSFQVCCWILERVMRFADKDRKTRILIGFICSKARHVQSRALSSCRSRTQLHSDYFFEWTSSCNRDTCPDCSHLSVAAVRLMESVRERLVASWNKAVASAVSTSSQHPKPAYDTHVYACNSCDSSCW